MPATMGWVWKSKGNRDGEPQKPTRRERKSERRPGGAEKAPLALKEPEKMEQ